MGMCTEKVKMKSKFIFLAVLIVSVLLNIFMIGRGCHRTDEVVIGDTIMIRDTIRIASPSPASEVVVRVDTVWLERVIDFASDVGSKDSVAVPIPITQKVYEDSLYKAWVSGYKPSLDSINVYRRETYIPVVMEVNKRPKIVLSAGVYGGFGAKGADYGIGVTLGVPIWSW